MTHQERFSDRKYNITLCQFTGRRSLSCNWPLPDGSVLAAGGDQHRGGETFCQPKFAFVFVGSGSSSVARRTSIAFPLSAGLESCRTGESLWKPGGVGGASGQNTQVVRQIKSSGALTTQVADAVFTFLFTSAGDFFFCHMESKTEENCM